MPQEIYGLTNMSASDPMGCSLPGSSVHVIFLARVLEWGAIAFSREVISESLYPTQRTIAYPHFM